MVIEEATGWTWGTRDYACQVPQAVSGGFLFGDLIRLDLSLLCGR